MKWQVFGNGRTIGKRGSEGGRILLDIEHIDGARISLEKDTRTAPFAITFGVYGVMLHTYFESQEESARQYVNATTQKIEALISHQQKDWNGEGWREINNRLIEDLIANPNHS